MIITARRATAIEVPKGKFSHGNAANHETNQYGIMELWKNWLPCLTVEVWEYYHQSQGWEINYNNDKV